MKYLLQILFVFTSTNFLFAQQSTNSNLNTIQYQEPFRFKIMLGSDTTKFNDMVIGHDTAYSDGLDGSDGNFFASSAPGVPGIYSIIGTSLISINATAAFTNDKVYRIGMRTNLSTASNYILRASNTTAYTGTAMLLFVDSSTVPPTITDLKSNSVLTYNFGAYAFINQRFSIRMCPSSYSYSNCQSPNSINISNPSLHPIKYQVNELISNTIVATDSNIVGNSTIAALTPGSYIVKLISETNAFKIDTINVLQPLTANILNNDTLLDIASATLTFNYNLSNDTAITYLWNFGDSTIVSSNDSVIAHTYMMPGIYVATLTATDNNGGCFAQDSITIQVTDFTNLNKNSDGNYSNYFFYSDNTIQTIFNKNITYSLFEIYNLLGEKITQFNTNTTNHKQTIDVTGLSRGVYILKNTNNIQTTSTKIYIK